jgi:hypothetical protein
MRLRTLLGDHPGTAALKDGSIKSDLVTFDFAEYSPTYSRRWLWIAGSLVSLAPRNGSA